jgi:hypothetical protein
MGICGGTADLVAQEEEERADRWGPHGSDTREIKHHGWNAQTKGESVIQRVRQGYSGQMG